jgi:hypothetical protein
MLLRTITLAAGFLALPATQAFLLPPEVRPVDIQVHKAFGPDMSDVQVVNVECPGCPVVEKSKHGNSIKVKAHRPNHLALGFYIDNRGRDRLMVNNFELYPSADPLHSFVAPQVLDTKKEHHDGGRKAERQQLGYTLQASTAMRDADGRLELVELNLQILEVGYTFVSGIPNVKIMLVKDRNNRLAIAHIEKTPPTAPLKPETERPQGCETMLCKLMAAAKEQVGKLKTLRPCHGGHMKGGMRPQRYHPRPHPHHHHGSAGGGHWPSEYRHHSWGQLFKNVGSHIVLPILVGIIAGVTISL